MLKNCTAWYVSVLKDVKDLPKDKNGKPIMIHTEEAIKGYTFNHLEDEHISNDKPTIKFKTQKGWINMLWKKQYCYLDNNYKVIVDDYLSKEKFTILKVTED
jgi:hypothetical protein